MTEAPAALAPDAVYGGRQLSAKFDGVDYVVVADGSFGFVQLGRGATRRLAIASARTFLRAALDALAAEAAR